MRKRSRIIILAALVAGLFVSTASIVNAQTFKTGANVSLQQKDQINQTIFVAAQNVDIGSEVFGDVFCAGQTVTITGVVHGDVICAGQTVSVSGQVDGDVRLVGQTVTLESVVKGNATIGGQTFTLSSKGSVQGDASIGSSIANLNGTIGRDLAIGSESVFVNNSIGRNIQAEVINLELAPTAKIAGNIDYVSPNKLVTKKGASIGGEVKQTVPKKESSSKNGAVFGFALGWFIYLLAALLLVSFVLAMLFPAMLKKVTDEASPTPWKALLVGLAASLVVPIMLIIISITIVGIPLAGLLGLSWLVVLMLSGPLSGFYLGRRLLRNSNSIPTIMLVGGGTLLILYFIPIIGFVFLLLAGWLGSGMLLLALRSHTPSPNYELIPKTKPKSR